MTIGIKTDPAKNKFPLFYRNTKDYNRTTIKYLPMLMELIYYQIIVLHYYFSRFRKPNVIYQIKTGYFM